MLLSGTVISVLPFHGPHLQIEIKSKHKQGSVLRINHFSRLLSGSHQLLQGIRYISVPRSCRGDQIRQY